MTPVKFLYKNTHTHTLNLLIDRTKTVLFPEGGGQPHDTGYIDNVKVYNVQREKIAHVHYTKEPIEVGKQVSLSVDWDRRWDHVQQHSGQHLLSAVMEQEPFNIETISWTLGEVPKVSNLHLTCWLKLKLPSIN
jgi:Ser-tRNA(Ala) deacylase AlaX